MTGIGGGGGGEGRMEEERGRGGGREEVVRWEKYLPRMVIRVLLVEADYATRQIVAALLRKCNYEVTTTPDGLKAWEILKRRHDDIDIVLTELDLPLISGYALLTLIMEHEGCRNTPVIMMSSHDSIGMAFKCLLKGAADFLIKPVRRNELKNLWQHIWKRLHINKHVSDDLDKNKGKATTKTDEVTNISSDDASSSLRDHESSEKASDAHSSCTTRYAGAESGSMENLQDASNLKHGTVADMDQAEAERCQKKMKLDKDSILLEDELGAKSIHLASKQHAPFSEECISDGIQIDDRACTGRIILEETLGQNRRQDMANMSIYQLPESSKGAIDLIGTIGYPQSFPVLQFSYNEENDQRDSAPQLDLSLSLKYLENHALDGRPKLTYSNSSAFSLYGDNRNSQALLPLSSGAGSELKGEQSLDRHIVTAEDAVDTPLFLMSLVSNHAYNGHTASSHVVKISNSHPGATHGPDNGNPSPAIPPILQSGITPSGPLQSEPKTRCSSPDCCLLDEVEELSGAVEGCEHGKVEYIEPKTDADVLSAASGVASSMPCNDLTSPASSTPCNDLTSPAKSNGETSRSTLEATDRQHAPANGLMHGQVRVTGSHHSAEREAALAKFRLKRKDRCYDKKVRYQSRKRLAEQRPRVKGQFVRQAQQD
ncbi:Two-component response regulator-like APRR5-like protein [Drosera capensis]